MPATCGRTARAVSKHKTRFDARIMGGVLSSFCVKSLFFRPLSLFVREKEEPLLKSRACLKNRRVSPRGSSRFTIFPSSFVHRCTIFDARGIRCRVEKRERWQVKFEASIFVVGASLWLTSKSGPNVFGLLSFS